MFQPHPALQSLEHRPWPLPGAPWRWRQSWLDLAFLHYRIDAARLSEKLPPGVRVQEFDGSAWVGIVPFRMAGVMRRPLPDLPHFSTFPELNLRTYVECDGKPGVWFFSLDARSRTMVWGGRWIYGLPYFYARMQQQRDGEWHTFTSERRTGTARFRARYRPSGAEFQATPGSFAHWATERYCLYSHSARRGIERVEVHHPPWPLQAAEVAIEENSLFAAANLPPPLDPPPVCHFSPGVRVVSFGNERTHRDLNRTLRCRLAWLRAVYPLTR